jgi:hypothetical protein
VICVAICETQPQIEGTRGRIFSIYLQIGMSRASRARLTKKVPAENRPKALAAVTFCCVDVVQTDHFTFECNLTACCEFPINPQLERKKRHRRIQQSFRMRLSLCQR